STVVMAIPSVRFHSRGGTRRPTGAAAVRSSCGQQGDPPHHRPARASCPTQLPVDTCGSKTGRLAVNRFAKSDTETTAKLTAVVATNTLVDPSRSATPSSSLPGRWIPKGGVDGVPAYFLKQPAHPKRWLRAHAACRSGATAAMPTPVFGHLF